MTYAKAAVAALIAALTVLCTLVAPHTLVWTIAEVVLAGVVAFAAVWRVPNQAPPAS